MLVNSFLAFVATVGMAFSVIGFMFILFDFSTLFGHKPTFEEVVMSALFP
jgi:hypothetical protein